MITGPAADAAPFAPSTQDIRSLRVVRRPSRLAQWRIPLTALALLLAYLFVYPAQIELSGDQTAQVVAARSLLEDGTYRTSLHDVYGPEVRIEIGADLRHPLRWFPPGYSLLLFGLAKAGLSMPAAALLLYYLLKVLWAVTWLAVGVALGIPFRTIAFSAGFLFFLTYPSTTTDFFESVAAGLVLLIALQPQNSLRRDLFTSLTIAAGILMRYAAVKLALFYAAFHLWPRTRRVPAVRLFLTLAPAAITYLFCTRVIGGEATPYHGVHSAAHIAWHLLPKAAYYAVTGGWSPSQPILKGVLLVFLAAAGIGLYRSLKLKALPGWIWLLAAWQCFCCLFLIAVQLRYASVYSSSEPAFATPRYYTLAQPLNTAALLVLAPLAFRSKRKALTTALAAVLILCAADWASANRTLLRSFARGTDGFLRPADLGAVFRLLEERHPDAIFNGIGVFLFGAGDPRVLYPYNVSGLRAPKDCRIAVVRFKGEDSALVNALEGRIAPCELDRIGTFEVRLYQLPVGFTL
ncbi:MAG TPA: hypothetical protein VKU19_02805 [Bryobacteraceae bacterium]|nr:hypothetical protein [Bryobacteraceae bacterium]